MKRVAHPIVTENFVVCKMQKSMHNSTEHLWWCVCSTFIIIFDDKNKINFVYYYFLFLSPFDRLFLRIVSNGKFNLYFYEFQCNSNAVTSKPLCNIQSRKKITLWDIEEVHILRRQHHQYHQWIIYQLLSYSLLNHVHQIVNSMNIKCTLKIPNKMYSAFGRCVIKLSV